MAILEVKDYADTVLTIIYGTGRMELKTNEELYPTIEKAMVALAQTTGLDIMVMNPVLINCRENILTHPLGNSITIAAWKTVGAEAPLEKMIALAQEIADRLRIFSSVRVDIQNHPNP